MGMRGTATILFLATHISDAGKSILLLFLMQRVYRTQLLLSFDGYYAVLLMCL